MFKRNESLKGAFYILLSSFFFGTYGIWAKLIGDKFDDFFQAWSRGVIVLLILLPLGYIFKSFKRIYREDVKWFLVISIPGGLVFPFSFYAFNNLSVGATTLLFFSSLTIGNFILGFMFFKEKMTRAKLLSLILGLLGLFLVSGKSIEGQSVLPVIAAIIGGLCGSVEVVFTRKVSDKYSPIQISVVVYISVLVLNLIFNLLFSNFNIHISGDQVAWLAQLAFSIAALLAFFFVVLGYKFVEPSVGGIIGLLEIVFGLVLGLLFFHESLNLETIIGGLLIIAAVLLPNILEQLGRRKSIND